MMLGRKGEWQNDNVIQDETILSQNAAIDEEGQRVSKLTGNATIDLR